MPKSKFLIDQNIPLGVVRFLQNKKYNCQLIKEIDPEISDHKIAKIASRENKILLTNDKDFIRLSSLFPKLVVVIFNFHDQSAQIRNQALKSIISELNQIFEKEDSNRIFIFNE